MFSRLFLVTFFLFFNRRVLLQQLERVFSRFLWGVEVEHGPRRIWRSWGAMACPTLENGLGFRHLSDVVAAYSAKLWWKWRTQHGLWASYVHAVSWNHSFSKSRLLSVDTFMRTHTRVQVSNGACSLLFDNWSGTGPLVDRFQLFDLDILRGLTIREAYSVAGWNLDLLSEFLPPAALLFVQAFQFHFIADEDRVIWTDTIFIWFIQSCHGI